jgi:hypothetical protein
MVCGANDEDGTMVLCGVAAIGGILGKAHMKI